MFGGFYGQLFIFLFVILLLQAKTTCIYGGHEVTIFYFIFYFLLAVLYGGNAHLIQLSHVWGPALMLVHFYRLCDAITIILYFIYL